MNSTRPPLPSLPEGTAPVVIWQIPPENPLSQDGKIAYKLEDIDGDFYGAKDEANMRHILDRFGFEGITAPQMERLRKRRLTLQRWRVRCTRRANKKYNKQ